MAPQWPITLPVVSQKLSASVNTNVARTDIKNGYPRQRNRFKNQISQYEVSWLFTDEEFYTFENFHRVNLTNGNQWFEIDLPATQGFQTVLARFVGGEYKAANKGVLNWTVSASLEVENNYGYTSYP
jgi:hypothetical protein